jgi:hypothetical protein
LAVMMCDRIACRNTASPFARSVVQKDPHWRIIGSSPATQLTREVEPAMLAIDPFDERLHG